MKRFAGKLLILFVLFLVSDSAYAGSGWVDDWLEQKTSTGADYFEGQKRGYYSGGSFNARWGSSKDYVVTAEVPRLSGGCGGIDTFLGGMSFMDFEYLVQKLQRILMNSGAVAFDLALSTLCEQCATSIKAVEAIANKLNSLSLDECSSGKNIVATFQDQLPDDVRGKMVGNAIKTSEVKQGIKDFFRSAVEEMESRDNVPDAGQFKRALSGCNAELKDAFLSDLLGAKTSLLESIGKNKLGLHEEYIDMIRGLAGDVYIQSAQSGFNVVYVSPCPANSDAGIAGLLDGSIEKKSILEQCSNITDTNRNLTKYIFDQLTGISDAMKSGIPLTEEQENIIKNTPIPISLIIKTGIKRGDEPQTVSSISELVAKSYVLQTLSDLYSRAMIIVLKGEELLKKKSAPESGQKSDSCKSEIFSAEVMQGLKMMLDRIYRLKQDSVKQYDLAVTQVTSSLQFSKRVFDDAEAKARKEILGRFVGKSDNAE